MNSQATLTANGPGNTYELINSIFAPNYTAVEAPDQCNSHPSFGRHIAEVFDATLNKYVFEFYIHVPTSFPVTVNTADNDRCLSFDRQRIEIKTYDQSPDSLIGTVGETVTYKWKFKLTAGFLPSTSFTHIHQVKAVGGDDDLPLFTLTARKASPNRLELLYVADSTSGSSRVASANLSIFQNDWVEVTEAIKIGDAGSYSMVIKKVSDGSTVLSYANANIKTIRCSNQFIRPKWGIYRSLATPSDLRDDSIRLADFSIAEIKPTLLITATPSTICNGNIVNFTATPSTNINTQSYQWKLNGSNVGSNVASYTSSSLTNGNTVVCVMTINSNCSSVTTATSNIITIAVNQTATSTTNLSICSNLLPYTWNGLVFNAAGSRTKNLISSSGCDSAATLNLTVTEMVTPNVFISTIKDTVCSGSNVTFTGIAANGGASPLFQWQKNGLNVGNGSSITFLSGTLQTGSIISCVLTANNACQTTALVNSNFIKLTVNPSPEIALITNDKGIALPKVIMCNLGSTTRFGNVTPYGAWSSDNNAVASINYQGIVTAKSNGTTNITYSVKSANNPCVSASNILLTVAQQPVPNISTGANSICVGSTTLLSNTTTIPSGGMAFWKSGNNRTSNTNNVYTARNAGVGEAIYIITNASGCSASSTYFITVNAIPNVPLIAYTTGTPLTGSASPFYGAPSGGFCVGKSFTVVGTPNIPQGVWTATGAVSITNTGLVNINATGLGSIKYTYTSAEGCVNSRTLSGNGFVCAARLSTVDSRQSNVEFGLYPNPTHTQFTIYQSQLLGAGSVVITDLYGKQVKTQPLSMGKNSINISSLHKGMYFVSTITAEGKTTKKLVLE
ncbi:MAG: T9SS type A sorting domain-containing protein [Chitinophagaceae bacterium]